MSTAPEVNAHVPEPSSLFTLDGADNLLNDSLSPTCHLSDELTLPIPHDVSGSVPPSQSHSVSKTAPHDDGNNQNAADYGFDGGFEMNSEEYEEIALAANNLQQQGGECDPWAGVFESATFGCDTSFADDDNDPDASGGDHEAHEDVLDVEYISDRKFRRTCLFCENYFLDIFRSELLL